MQDVWKPVDSSETASPAPPPDPSEQTLTFLFFSDTQPDPETMDFTGVGELLVLAIERHENISLVTFGGDTVDNGANAAEWLDFHRATGAALDNKVTAAVAGNHDNHVFLADQFSYPSVAPSSPAEGFFYTLRMGHVFFLMLDSNIMGAANESDIEWLQGELQSDTARQADWRIAVMHHPMWPTSDIPKDIQRAETMREHFLPILEEHGVTLILCGHQHTYSRTHAMRGDTMASDGSGVVQIMAASGGKASYAPGERDYIAVGSTAPNYVLLEADSQSLIVTAYDGEHKVIDYFTIHR